MKHWRWFVLGLVALPLVVLAQDGGDQLPRGRRGGFYREGMGSPTTRPWGRYGMNLEPVDDADWGKVESFMKENLPNTLSAYNKMADKAPDGSPWNRKEGAKRRIYAQYKELMQLEEKAADGSDKGAKARYQARLDQAKKGDEILGLVMKWHNADPKEKPARRQELRAKVKERIQAELKERQAQIEALRNRLEEQEKKLQADQSSLDKNLESRVEFFIDHSAQFVNPVPPAPRGNGSRGVPPAREGIDNAGEQP